MKFWRINLIFALFILFGAAIIGRLAYLQIHQADFYSALAQGRYGSSLESQTERGEIFLKDGEALAINKSFTSVFASPVKILEVERTAEILNKILGLPKNFILERLKGEGLYSPIKSRLTDKEVEDLSKLKIQGIYLAEEKGRYYPQENMASQVAGFLDANLQGQYGLEGYYNNQLSEQGIDLKLTIDYDIQFFAEKLLKKAEENLAVKSGLILVLDPRSGKIIALANLPNFNPNQYKDYAKNGNMDIFQNGAAQKIFEPGSVFKPITMAAALEEEKITPDTKYTDTGMVQVGNRSIYNYDNRVYGLQTMTNVLEKSINTGAVFAERQLGHSLFLKYVEKFGFFSSTGLDLPEVYSQNKELKKGYEINYTTAAFGQGIEITPIQLARAFSAIANGGKLVRPYLAEKIGGQKTEPELFSSVISSKTASQLTAMLTSVVENGFSKKAKIPGYYIAGKTGTAQVPEAGKYSSDKTVQSFIGFFPAFSPQFLILVKLDNPQTKTAEYSALPVFRELAGYVLRLYQVPPDYER